MNYLILWSGQMYGMRKFTVSAVRHSGLVGHWRDGELWRPCVDEIAAGLAARYRAMFERCKERLWIEKDTNDGPAKFELRSVRGDLRHILYAQTLTEKGVV